MEIIAGSVMKSMVSLFVARSNLVLQIVLVALLVASLVFKKRRNYFLHGSTMMIAAILNAFSFILVMGPSLFDLGQFVVSYPLDRLSMVAMAHGILGAMAEVLAIWVLASWRLRSSTKYCARKRKSMQVTLVLWLIALFSGILFYVLLHTALLVV